jgi:hypothetical protein
MKSQGFVIGFCDWCCDFAWQSLQICLVFLLKAANLAILPGKVGLHHITRQAPHL